MSETLVMETPVVEPWRKYIPSWVHLYYVDYRDDLSEHMDLLQECVEKNNLFPLSEQVFDWWDSPTYEYVKEIERNMKKDGLDFDDEWIDEICDVLYDQDRSDPIKDLLGNTGKLNMYYSLGAEVDGWHSAFMCNPWRGDSYEMAEYKMRRALRVNKGTKQAEQIHSIVVNAPYGGDVRIYFQANLKDMLSTEYEEDAKDFRTIHFKGKFAVALYNSLEGSGDYEIMELDFSVPFNRENLAISQSDRYSIEQCFGMWRNWIDETDAPRMSFEGRKAKKSDHPTAAAQQRAQEAEYIKTFKAGGCTLGDTDFRRHRDVYYRNEIPCGNVCPHCGQFWID